MSGLKILIVEPNTSVTKPYIFFPHKSIIHRVPSIELATKLIIQELPDLVCISASYSSRKTISFLEALHHELLESIVPVLFVVDTSHRLNFVPGLEWGSKLRVATSESNKDEVQTILDNIL